MPLALDDEGGWIDLLPVKGLNRDHRDEYIEKSVKIREAKEKALAAAAPAVPEEVPENPAYMPDPADKPAVTLTRLDVRPLQDMLLGWIVRGSSFDGVAPWVASSAPLLPLPSWNILEDALDPYYDALNGVVPKAPTTTSSDTSATT
jgi:hypothetical protein